MARMHSRRGMRGIGRIRRGCGFDFDEGDHSRPEQCQLAVCDRHHGGFESHRTRPAVEHREVVAERTAHVLGSCRRQLGESIRAGRGERDAGFFDQLQRKWMSGDADTDGRQSGGDDVRDTHRFGKYQR
jgi:hypothetical protein